MIDRLTPVFAVDFRPDLSVRKDSLVAVRRDFLQRSEVNQEQISVEVRGGPERLLLCHRFIVMPLLALCVPHFPHFSHQFPGLLGVFVMGVAESVSGPQSQDLHHHAFSSAPRPLTFHQFFTHSLLASTLSP